MIKTIWFLIKISLVTYGAFWLLSQDGMIDINFLGYDVKTKTGLFLLSIIIIFVLAYALMKIVKTILSSPKKLIQLNETRREKVGYDKLTQGLAAVAAGDANKATSLSKSVDKLFGQNKTGLTLLLQAQAARLRGEENLAQTYFETMLEDKNAAFLGLRGLLKSSLDKGDYAAALRHAKSAYKNYPKQDWLLNLVYDLELKNHHWDAALSFSKKIEKYKILDEDKINSDRVAIYLMRYDFDKNEQGVDKAFYNLKMAYKLSPDFPPVVLRYGAYLIEKNKVKKAQSLVIQAWKTNPHPQLAVLWNDLYQAQNKDNETKKLAYFQRLIEANDVSVESYIAVAQCAVDLGFWGEAKAHLMAAQKIESNAKIIDLKHQVEKNITHSDDTTWLKNNDDITPLKRWTCLETGRVYKKWSAIAPPHDSFNTISWDYPMARPAPEIHSLSAAPILLTDPES